MLKSDIKKDNSKARALFKDAKSYKTIYTKWHDMIRRCYEPKCSNYKNYGARGIKVCDEWKNDDGLYNFCEWILSVGYDFSKSGREQSIDKINNDGNYEPSNCRLANQSIQNGNMRTKTKTGYKGVRLHSSKTCYYTGVKIDGLFIFIGSSKSKNECAKMRNDYIIKNDLKKPLNIIKPELEDVRPTSVIIYRVYDKNNVLLYESNNLEEICRKINVCSYFVWQCINKKRNSKLYNFEKEEKIIYEY